MNTYVAGINDDAPRVLKTFRPGFEKATSCRRVGAEGVLQILPRIKTSAETDMAVCEKKTQSQDFIVTVQE